MKHLGIPAVIAAVLMLSACSSEPSPESAVQRDCRSADRFMPTLIDAQAGDLGEEDLRTAERDLRTLLNDGLVEPDGQVGAMLYVLGAPVWSDADGVDASQASFDDFHRQLIEYCEGFADWEMTH